MTYTAKQIMEAIETDFEGYDSEFWHEAGDAAVELPSLGITTEPIEDFGGEGMGDSVYVIFKIGDQFFKKDGYYSSWNGTDWDEGEPLHEVAPAQEMVTVYKAV